MRFSFTKNYRFECQKCGRCCNQRSLALTEPEYQRLKSSLECGTCEISRNPVSMASFAPYNASFGGNPCPLLRNKLCSNYDERPIVCRLFPLQITALPNGELFVNLIHCNGVSLSHGAPVDERFVKDVLNDLDKSDKTFLPSYIQNRSSYHSDKLFPFFTIYDRVDFNSKRLVITRVSEWLTLKSAVDKPIDIRCRAVLEVLDSNLPRLLTELCKHLGLREPPFILIKEDIDLLLSKLESNLDELLSAASRRVLLKKKKLIGKMRRKGKIEIEAEGKIKTVLPDSLIPYVGPRGETVNVQAKELIKMKPIAEKGRVLLDDFIVEVLNRIDEGGFPMDMPIPDILESLYRFSQALITHSTAYSQNQDIISERNINDAITYLDTLYTLGMICRNVVEEMNQIRMQQRIGFF